MNVTNHQIRLAARPVGMAKASDWKFTEEPVVEPADGQLLIKIEYISLDPAMRLDQRDAVLHRTSGHWRRDAGGAAGRVIESKHEKFTVGDHVVGALGVQEYALSNGAGVTKVDTRIAPLPVYLGTLGMPGMTAYFGLLDIGQPKPGETVVVSAAAGAVGSVVGQIAKIKGCRVVGIAGGPQKCQYVVNDLGFDAAIDYKQEDVYTSLRKHCPKGIDIYFDNVGGDILDAALAQLTRGADSAVRSHLAVQQSRKNAGTEELLIAAHQPGEHQGLYCVRLCRPLRRGGVADGRLADWREAQVARRHRRRPADLPGDVLKALQRRELRQAAAESGRRLRFRIYH